MQTKHNKQRHHYLDWIRGIATGTVFIFHVLCIFGYTPFQLRNSETSLTYTALTGFIFYWLMPLFFLVAGISSKLSLDRRDNKTYLKERCKRLIIPFLTGFILLALPQDYVEALNKGQFSGSFIDFIPFHINRVITLSRNSRILLSSALFAEFAHHVWFLAFLLIYSMTSLPLFRYFQGKGEVVIKFITNRINGPFKIFLPAVLLFIILSALRPLDKTYSGWPAFVYWGTFFILGFIIYYNATIMDLIEKHRLLTLVVALVSYGLLTVHTIIYDFKIFENPDYSLTIYIGNLFWAITAWSWVIFILGICKSKLNRSSARLKKITLGSVPFYLLHLPVVLIVAYFIVQLNLNLNIKFILITSISLLVTLLLIKVIVRRFRVTAFLFGTRTINNTKNR